MLKYPLLLHAPNFPVKTVEEQKKTSRQAADPLYIYVYLRKIVKSVKYMTKIAKSANKIAHIHTEIAMQKK